MSTIEKLRDRGQKALKCIQKFGGSLRPLQHLSIATRRTRRDGAGYCAEDVPHIDLAAHFSENDLDRHGKLFVVMSASTSSTKRAARFE
jgi:hypothetical protein